MGAEEELDANASLEESQSWENIDDPLKRRQMQNRYAQRRFRESRRCVDP
jgi:hypothetical protein